MTNPELLQVACPSYKDGSCDVAKGPFLEVRSETLLHPKLGSAQKSRKSTETAWIWM